jgi:hypothetical protein
VVLVAVVAAAGWWTVRDDGSPSDGDVAGVVVAPEGDGAGTEADPASLTDVLGGTVPVEPGTTIWLRAGTYPGPVTSELAGTEQARITVRSYPGEWAVIESPDAHGGDVLTVAGRYTDVRDLEVRMSDPDRSGVRDAGITVQGHGNRVIHTYVHDTGCGITSFSEATDVVIAANTILNVGSSDRSVSCHSIYAANQTGEKVIEDNIWFGSGWYGLHLYTEGGGLEGLVVRGNVGAGPNLIGGAAPVDDLLVEGNDLATLHIGYGADNGSIVVSGNRFGWTLDGRGFDLLRRYESVMFTGNTVVGDGNDGLRFENDEGADPADQATWDDNTYVGVGFAYPTRPGEWPCCGVDFDTWRAAHPGWDGASTWSTGPPDDVVDVRPDRYDDGRATIVAHTWSGAATIAVDPSGVLERGERYEVRSALDPLAEPLASGTWEGGEIELPTDLPVAAPLGDLPIDRLDPSVAIYLLRSI